MDKINTHKVSGIRHKVEIMCVKINSNLTSKDKNQKILTELMLILTEQC